MISYVEEQGSIASVVHRDGSRTQFVAGITSELIGWDEEEICYLTSLGEANFFSSTGENLGMYRLSMEKHRVISFNAGTLLFEDTGLGIKYRYNRETGETRNASY
jgi:hypothetical protein